MTVARRARELRALVDEVADGAWRDPAWWLLVGLAATVETIAARAGRAAAPYLSSDAEPHADTFLGWPRPAPRRLADAIADAIVDAVAAARALDELDGTLPGQPLRVAIARDGDGAATRVAADPWRVRFVVAGRRATARVSGGPDELRALAAALARLATAPPTTGHADAAAVAIAAVVGDHPPEVARHLHRRGWTDRGGPWLGVGRAGDLAVATTCHLVVDGYGHALIAARIAAARDPALHAALARAAAEVVDGAPVPAPPPLAGARPLGVAWRRVDGPLPRFTALAHALGVALRAPGAARSPTIQVPVAPGARDDPARWRRRVVHALVSVRFDGDAAEPVATFAARATAAIAREVDGGGLLTRLVAAAAAIPVPLAIKRRRLVGARSPRFDGIVEVLAGRAALSILRLQPGDAPAAPPLVAVSAPGHVPPPGDPRATSVITIVADDTGATFTLAGAGAAADPDAAAALLDRWLAVVDAHRPARSRSA